MSLYDAIAVEVDKLIEKYKVAVADGSFSLKEAMALAVDATGQFIRLAQSVGGSGADKKAAVLAALDRFMVEVVRPIDLPGPDAFVDPLVEQFVHYAADFLIDGLVRLLKSQGVLV